MKRIMKFIKEKLNFFILILVALVTFISASYAATIMFQADEVGYDNTNSGFKDSNGDDVENVQTALDELYDKASTCVVRNICPVGYAKLDGYDGEYSCIKKNSPKSYIESLNTEGETISTTDHYDELRFIGADPPNYVKFNGSVWRIIGVFEGKLKLVGPNIGSYSYDSSMYNVNNGYGVNAWEDADLMKLLNPGYSTNMDYKCVGTYSGTTCGSNSSSDFEQALVNNSLYWDAGQGLCYDYADLRVKSCDFRSSGLTDSTSKLMIDDATWYLGSNPAADDLWGTNQSIMNAAYLYNIERSNNSGKQCSSGTYCTDQVTRNNPPTWTGKVGLLYPSDYAYATSGDLTGSGTDRTTCLSKKVSYVSADTTPNWSNTYTDCLSNDWLYTNQYTWSLSPRALSSYSTHVFNVHSSGYVTISTALNAYGVRPVVYLKSSVIITRGDGTQSKPFELLYEAE